MPDLSKIELVAQVHNYMRPLLNNALRSQRYTEPNDPVTGGYQTAYDRWTRGFGDRFFDMTTMIRLGSTIEGGLKQYYSDDKGFNNAAELRRDLQLKKYSTNVFQRLSTLDPKGVVSLYKAELNYDLATNLRFPKVQEAMVHRHLYAHGMGVLDEKYIADIKDLTNVDIAAHPDVAAEYPRNDVYWFQPLSDLSALIEATKQFFSDLP